MREEWLRVDCAHDELDGGQCRVPIESIDVLLIVRHVREDSKGVVH